MTSYTWQDVLSAVRSGDGEIATAPNGIPLVAVNAPFYELMEMMEALTTGYNNLLARAAEDQKRIERISKLAKAQFPSSKKNTYNWVRVKDRLPDKSGDYYTFGTSLGVHTLSYSALYKMWNTSDYATEEEAKETAITEVTHWCEIPTAPVVPEPIPREED